MVRLKLFPQALTACRTAKSYTSDRLIVKFDTAKLPAILNSLETDNNGQKLVLEVSVCTPLASLNHEDRDIS